MPCGRPGCTRSCATAPPPSRLMTGDLPDDRSPTTNDHPNFPLEMFGPVCHDLLLRKYPHGHKKGPSAPPTTLGHANAYRTHVALRPAADLTSMFAPPRLWCLRLRPRACCRLLRRWAWWRGAGVLKRLPLRRGPRAASHLARLLGSEDPLADAPVLCWRRHHRHAIVQQDSVRSAHRTVECTPTEPIRV